MSMNLLISLLLLLVGSNAFVVVNGEEENAYIVYMGDQSSPVLNEAILDTYVNVLSSVKESPAHAKEAIVHSYTSSFKAFAARLSPDEAAKLARMEGVILVFRNQYHQLHTTRSWDFVGFPLTVTRTKRESDVIIGLIDTGISPGIESFNDKGIGPPPAKWKGTCGHFANFSGCNNKIIGAKYFKFDHNADPSDKLSPADMNGHGTHTSSTAAGNTVENANLYGLGKGTARGAVPSARIAMYKVCWEKKGCSDIDILAAFDAAIHDGVDVISISIGGTGSSTSYANDTVGLGSFHAMKRGIVTVASGGNTGPDSGTIQNHAPWIITVAASGTDRQYISKAMLGNGKSISGVAVNTFVPNQKQYPLVSGANVGLADRAMESKYCSDGSLDPKKVKGKVVYCELEEKDTDEAVKQAGAVGIIFGTEMTLDNADIFALPATMVNSSSIGEQLNMYINRTRTPSAVILKSEEVKVPAPFSASFSSRGPNPANDKILKPDISAPGVNILAGYTPLRSLSGDKGDNRYSHFSIMSGTSMACPHVAGTAAYVRSFHPGWTAAAIKSAIVTTATQITPHSEYDSAFSYGAGQINPRDAAHPGLVYDIYVENYIQYLCNEGYDQASLKVLLQSDPGNCSKLPPGRGDDALNYPTMQLKMDVGLAKTVNFERTVTNVGPAQSVYNAVISAPQGTEVTVKPMILTFTKMFEKRSFTLTIKASAIWDTKVEEGSLVWKSDKHVVRSPIVVYCSTNNM